MKLYWRRTLLYDLEYQLIIEDTNGREYTGYLVRQVGDGFIAIWFGKILADSFNAIQEAQAYCEVLYRMGVNHE